MIVRCRSNNVANLRDTNARERLLRSIHLPDGDSDLAIGADYSVQAVETWQDGSIMLYLHTVDSNNYPFAYPIEFFEVLDGALPKDWICVKHGADDEIGGLLITFPAWAKNRHFFENLIDDGASEIAIYLRHS